VDLLFHYIKGTYEESGKDFVVIDSGGIGYKIFTSPSTIGRMGSTGQVSKLYTYYHVREDIMALYGFLTREELDMFELLISVSGVGPKAGLAVLSVLSPAKLGLSIMGGDIKSLTTVPGIGSKTAHRIILELKDKIDKDDILGLDIDASEISGDTSKEAVNALMALGYSAVEASSAVRKISTEDKDTEKIIKEALKNLMK
jgi:Holliday junction DNA helicase RuvA